MKKIITFCLYGDDPIYYIGAIENAKLCSKIYPGWTCRFYLDVNTSEDIKKNLLDLNSEVIECEVKNGQNPMLWRFLVYDDDSVDVWISRDCDSRLNYREKSAVDEWLDSEKIFHIIRDAHNHNYYIMGGTFGLKSKLYKEKKGKNSFQVNLDYRGGDDQMFLKQNIWEHIKNDYLCHDHWRYATPKEPIFKEGDPVKWSDAYSVGLINYVKRERELLYPELFNTPEFIKKFPDHDPVEFGIFVGQRIGPSNKPIINLDTRWEYEMRGIYIYE